MRGGREGALTSCSNRDADTVRGDVRCATWDDIEAWGEARRVCLKQYLALRNGIPGHDTIRRVFESLPPVALESQFVEWALAVCGALEEGRRD